MDPDLIEIKISESSGELFIGEVSDQSWEIKPAWLAKFPWVKPSYRGKDYAFCSICYSHLKITSGPFNLETHQRSSKHHIATKCRATETPTSDTNMDTDSDQQSETHVAAYFRRWIHRHQEAPGCLSKATQDPTCKICFQGFVRLKSFCKHAKIHFEQNIMKCSFCGEDFFSKDALANHMRMPLEGASDSRSPSPTPAVGAKPFLSVYTPNLTNRDSKEVINPVNSFGIPRSKPYTGGAKPPSYWEWVREAYPHIQLSEEVIQQLEAESKNTDQVNDESSFQAMVDLIMSREKQKQMQESVSASETPLNPHGRTPAAPPGTINCHLCNANIRRYDFQAHLLVAHSAAATQPPKFFSCPVCGKSFPNSKDLFQHKLQAHTEQVSPQRPVQSVRQCNLCNEMCQNLDELTQHALHVHGVGGNGLPEAVEENLICPLCATYRFNRRNRDQFDRHLLLYCHGRLFAQKLTTKRIRDLSVSLNVDPIDVMRLLQECKLLQWNDELTRESGSWTERCGLNERNLPQTLHDGLFYMKTWTNELEDWHSEVPTGDYIRLEAEAERFGPFAFGEYNRQVEPAVERLLPRPPDPGPFRLDYDSLVLVEKVDGIFRQHNLCDAVDIERSRVQSLWEEAVRFGRSSEMVHL